MHDSETEKDRDACSQIETQAETHIQRDTHTEIDNWKSWFLVPADELMLLQSSLF